MNNEWIGETGQDIRKDKFLSELEKKEIEDQVNQREREVIENGEED